MADSVEAIRTLLTALESLDDRDGVIWLGIGIIGSRQWRLSSEGRDYHFARLRPPPGGMLSSHARESQGRRYLDLSWKAQSVPSPDSDDGSGAAFPRYSRTVRSAILHVASSRCIRVQMRCAVCRCLRGAFLSASRIASIKSTASFSVQRGRSGFFRGFGNALSNRFAHHPPVHSQLPGHPHDRSDPELILSADLLE